ncbi:hypothetical protein D3C76_1266620 [compost metagenome]
MQAGGRRHHEVADLRMPIDVIGSCITQPLHREGFLRLPFIEPTGDGIEKTIAIGGNPNDPPTQDQAVVIFSRSPQDDIRG